MHHKLDWLLRQFDELGYLKVILCAKHSCQTSFQSEEIWIWSPALVRRHWRPAEYRIEFKTLMIAFKGLHGKAPRYTQEIITPSESRRYSMSSIPKVKKIEHDTFSKRVFAVCGPLAWNCLLNEITRWDEIEAFKQSFKTYVFVKFVNESILTFSLRIIVKHPKVL